MEAHSPQAKGRIERSFRTFQDRLKAEMRVKGIRDIDKANKILDKSHKTKRVVIKEYSKAVI